jgi:hypothetical protein
MGSSVSSPDKVEAPIANYGQDIKQMLSAYRKSMPGILKFERQYRPQFQDLNLQDVSRFGLGMLGMSPEFTQQTAQQLGAAREAELGQMTGQAGLTRGLIAGLSPEQASAVQQAQQESQRSYASAQGVTPQERRMYQQTAREGAQAAGRVGGNAAIASEIMGREDVMARKRAEAAQAGQQAFNLAGQFYTAPGLQLLGSQPLSYQVGNQMMGLGLDAIGAGKPQLFDVGSALNLGAAQRQNIVNAQAANAQAQASYSSGLFGGLGGLAQGVGSAAAAAIPFMMSDKRLKTDIEKVGKTDAGLPIYTYKYKGDSKTQMGVMAQDVKKKTPKAVKEVGGFKAVNYALVK